MRALIVGLVLASLSAAARADEVGVVVTGEAVLQPQLRAGVEGWLRDHGRSVAASPLPPEATNKLIDCFVIEDLACARGVVEGQSSAPAVVYARVDVAAQADGSRDFTLLGYWFAKGHAPVAERRTCRGCTEQGMRDTLATLLAALEVKPDPAPLAPAPVPAVVVVPEAPPPSKMIPVAIAGTGAALLVTGIVLIAIDQDADPHGPQAPTYRDTAASGVVFSLLGVAALGAGGYLWWRDHHGGAPIAAASGRGGIVGWSGRF
jgi:hypothetical protein